MFWYKRFTNYLLIHYSWYMTQFNIYSHEIIYLHDYAKFQFIDFFQVTPDEMYKMYAGE